MSFSNYLENKLLDVTFGDSTWYCPASVWLALSTAHPGETGASIAEPTRGAYARAITGRDDWNAASGGTKDNATDITFNAATYAWGTIAFFGLFDAATAGNMLICGTWTAAKTIASGDTAKVNAGDLAISLD